MLWFDVDMCAVFVFIVLRARARECSQGFICVCARFLGCVCA